MSTVKTCVVCSRTLNGHGTKCSACIKRAQRAKKALLETLPEVSIDIPMSTEMSISKARLLPVDTSLPFSHQKAQALAMDKHAVHNTRGKKDEWVIPGKCEWGVCLNPNCQLHEEDPEEAKRSHQSNKTVKTKPSIPDALREDPNIKIASEAFRGKLCPHNMVWGTCGYASCKKKG